MTIAASLSFSLFQKLCRKEENNFVFSPLSLGAALAMLTAGLKGETKTELLELFGTLDDEELHSAYSDLLSNKKLPLKIANKFLTDRDCEVQESFDSLLREKYECEVERVNFAENAREIVASVNAWVNERTNGMIPQLLSEGSFGGETIFVLLNAIYFKGSWFEEFYPVSGLGNFTLRNGDKVQRSFIFKSSESLGYGETDKLRVVKIPYKEAGFYMLAAIPKNENEHIDEVMASAQLAELISAVKSQEWSRKVVLSMPKFKIEFNHNEVEKNLNELGVRKIFVSGVGDFGNLFSKAKRSPFVGAIIHKAVIEVDEKGTTAAAVTAVMCFGGCSPSPKIVKLNRPFCFLIMSAEDTICFAGICADP